MIGKRFSSDDEVLARLRRLEHRVNAVQLGTGTTNVTNITETGVENFIELGDVPQTYAGATGELPSVNAAEDGLEFNPYVTVNPTVPILTVRNLTDAEVDCICRYAVGASPVVKWTHGLDDSDGDKWKLAVGDAFGDAHDVIVVTSGEGSTPGVAEFTLIDTWQTPISGVPELPVGVCTDGTYIYYTVGNPGALVKIDPVAGTENLRNTPSNKMFGQIACDGTYLYVIQFYGGSLYIEKYACSDLAYVDATDLMPETVAALFYWSGHLYCTDNSNGIRKVRCSDMSLIWRVSYPAGNPHECWPHGIATDGTYLYVLDDKSNGIIRLNMDGTWVDLTAVANPMQNDSLWISGQYLYVGVNTSRVDQLLKSDISLVATFNVAASIIRQGTQYNGYHYLASEDDTCIYKYTSTSTEAAGVSYLQVRLKDIYGLMFDVARFTGGGRLGVGTTIPTETIEAVGNIKATAGQFISTLATGTAPHVVTSTTVCANLNAGLVDGYHHDQSLLTTAGPTFDHLHLTTDLAVADGGTGKSSFTLYAIPYASGTTIIGEIAIGTAGQMLTVNGGANGYVWVAALSNPMTDIGDMIIGGAAGVPAKLADVAVGAYLRSGGVTTAPLWSTLVLPNAATAYRLPVATAANTIGELAAVGATGQYLAGATGAIPAWATLNQAAVAGLTTADGPPFDHLHVTGGTSALFSTYKGANSDGSNIFIGGGGQSSVGEAGATHKGSYNTALGLNTLNALTKGYSNSALGVNALYALTTGFANIAIGVNTLPALTTGSANIAIGGQALLLDTTGSYNTAVGMNALYDLNILNGTGANTAVGCGTGLGIVTGVNNTILGANVSGLAAALSNNIILATGAGVIKARHDGADWTLTGGLILPVTAMGLAAPFQLKVGYINFASTGTWRTVATITTSDANYAGGYFIFSIGGVHININYMRALLIGTFVKTAGSNPVFTLITSSVDNCLVQCVGTSLTELAVQMKSISGANAMYGNFAFLVLGSDYAGTLVAAAPGYVD